MGGIKLKPCPFCGGEANWGCDGSNPDYGGEGFTYYVCCVSSKCGACREDFETKQEAIKAWNTRNGE